MCWSWRRNRVPCVTFIQCYTYYMKISAYIQQLRSKPEHVRRRIAFWSSFGVTAVIFAFWLASFTAAVASPQDISAVAKINTPGQSLIAGVGNFFGDIKDMIFGTKKVTYAEVEVSPGN